METYKQILETINAKISTMMDDYPGFLSFLVSLVIIIVVVN